MRRPSIGAVRRLGGRAAPRLRRVAKRARDRSPLWRLKPPVISVIAPFYNVEEYLGACLDSIAAQTYGNYEVLLVDDGSPDGSRAVAERYAQRDPRLRIVTRPNGGLGAARNTGVRAARGRFLTFVDTDDRLPPNALELLVASARRTGSDIVVGAVQRFDSRDTWRPRWVEGVHLQPREAVTLAKFLPVIRNLYTWNKLFRTDFWRQQDLWFREGVAYEDQPIITQLYARARGIDVLSDVVYDYRYRDDRSSISQQTASVEDLRSRIDAWHLSRETLLREAPREIYDGWLLTLFQAHFHWYLNSPGTTDDTYWSELRDAVVELTSDAPQWVWDATPPAKRVVLELTRQGRRAEAQELVRRRGDQTERWESEVRDDGVLLHLPCFDEPDLDRSLFLLRPEQLELAHSVENFHWLGPPDHPVGTFSMAGWAFLGKLDLSQVSSSVGVVLRDKDTGAEHVFDSLGQTPSTFPPPLDDLWCDYAPGTFRVQVPMDEVVGSDGRDQRWEVLLRVSAGGFTRTAPVTTLVRSGSAGAIPAVELAGGRRLHAEWRRFGTLQFAVSPVDVRVEEVRLDGRTLSGALTGPAARDVVSVEVTSGTASVAAAVGVEGENRRFTVELPAPARPVKGEPVVWGVVGIDGDGRPHELGFDEDLDAVARPGGVLEVQRSRGGTLALREWQVLAVADGLEVDHQRGAVRVRGQAIGTDVSSVAVVARSTRSRAVGEPVPVEQGRFEAVLPLRHQLLRFGTQPLPMGEHDLSLVITRGKGGTTQVPLKLAPSLADLLPLPVDTEVHQGRVVRGARGGTRVSLVRPIGDARGRYQQQRLKQRESTVAGGGLTRGVLMRSYFGEHATDNGLSVQRELRRRGSDLPVYWAVQDHSIPVPEGGIPVVVNSREWYQLLGSVAYYIDNMYQPEYHRKPPGQVIVQTFHGYPFKTMGHPHWQRLNFSQERIDSYDRRARDWDYLVSPARYATPLLERDFGYDGTTLEIGYPRNDVLSSAYGEELRAATRASLGVAEDQTAVLYAPTFRDYLARNDNQARMPDFFDIEAASRLLGEGVVLLVRGHAFNARTKNERVRALPGVVDVTDYPEVSDLYLAADAAVVDYSSLRFDFAVTGKPMVFHVPDLQRYEDTRGWLVDFAPTAPGPHVDTTLEVVHHLQDLGRLRTAYADRYRTFRDEYLDLEDGRAGERLVDAVFAVRGDA